MNKKTIILLSLLSMILLGACNRDIEEFRFTGRVVGSQLCSSSQIGYAIDIVTPDSVGQSVNISGTQYRNAVMAYKAPRILHMDDTVNGVAYFTKSYAELNCFGISEFDLPEMIILSLD
ncbi:MAG: hypothetical protein K5842_01440 [Bacteroidales bacterium]|nr:hypothetical protein [Bacteroidales bacterium]